MSTQHTNQSILTTITDPFEEVSVESDERALVEAAQRGSIAAFNQLIERFEARVFRVAQSIVRNREDSEEVMQNAFLQAFKNLVHFRGDSRFYTWLIRITINEGLMIVRRRRLNDVSIDDVVESEDKRLRLELRDLGPTPEQRCSQVEVQKILATAINKLPSKCRNVFQLRDVDGLSTEETARLLDLSLSAVKTRLRRARLQLQESLDGFFKAMFGQQYRERIPSARQF
jgi:RNA polymerase sigma-70 factor (ECF subfamily)